MYIIKVQMWEMRVKERCYVLIIRVLWQHREQSLLPVIHGWIQWFERETDQRRKRRGSNDDVCVFCVFDVLLSANWADRLRSLWVCWFVFEEAALNLRRLLDLQSRVFSAHNYSSLQISVCACCHAAMRFLTQVWNTRCCSLSNALFLHTWTFLIICVLRSSDP